MALLLGVSEASSWGWVVGARASASSPPRRSCSAAWVAVELRSRVPLVDVRLMRTPIVWWTNVSAFLFGFGMYSMMVVLPAVHGDARPAGYGFDASVTAAPAWRCFRRRSR